MDVLSKSLRPFHAVDFINILCHFPNIGTRISSSSPDDTLHILDPLSNFVHSPLLNSLERRINAGFAQLDTLVLRDGPQMPENIRAVCHTHDIHEASLGPRKDDLVGATAQVDKSRDDDRD